MTKNGQEYIEYKTATKNILDFKQKLYILFKLSIRYSYHHQEYTKKIEIDSL